MEQEDSGTRWDDKEMKDVNSERAHLVGATSPRSNTSSTPPSSWKPRLVNLTGLTLACLVTSIVAYFSFANGLTLFSFHPTTMSFGWLVFMPMAINALRAGDLATSWIPVPLRSTRHWLLQSLAALFVTTGFIVIIVNKIKLGKNHFTTLHGIFGLVSVILMYLTLSGGIGALYSIKLKKILPPAYTKVIHGFAGLATLTFGIVTVILGLFSNTITEESMKWSGLVAAVLLLILTILRPAIGMYVRLKERLCYVH